MVTILKDYQMMSRDSKSYSFKTIAYKGKKKMKQVGRVSLVERVLGFVKMDGKNRMLEHSL